MQLSGICYDVLRSVSLLCRQELISRATEKQGISYNGDLRLVNLLWDKHPWLLRSITLRRDFKFKTVSVWDSIAIAIPIEYLYFDYQIMGDTFSDYLRTGELRSEPRVRVKYSKFYHDPACGDIVKQVYGDRAKEFSADNQELQNLLKFGDAYIHKVKAFLDGTTKFRMVLTLLQERYNSQKQDNVISRGFDILSKDLYPMVLVDKKTGQLQIFSDYFGSFKNSPRIWCKTLGPRAELRKLVAEIPIRGEFMKNRLESGY